ncbi:MarR family winged helix-turn-helix transcriptional regulator [Jonesia quinghaiensis]|uniref:MarR family winged helix-turn-helix transcriptional regulator n=1 Tax=Jonesia quinghaiensis TaxID=262806 RepID=UPI000410285D|nr:MarR family winged helix-turn-helix transcriptional regulator [Jonesia quinghaiensis]
MDRSGGITEHEAEELARESAEYHAQASQYRAHPVAELIRLVMEWTTPVMLQSFVDQAELRIDAVDLPHFSFFARYEKMHPSELARLRGIGPSAVSKLVARLAAAEYVVRESDPMDRRANYIVLAPQGQAAATRYFKAAQQQLDAVISDWTPKERETFTRLVQGISAQWAAYTADTRSGALPSSLDEYVI